MDGSCSKNWNKSYHSSDQSGMKPALAVDLVCSTIDKKNCFSSVVFRWYTSVNKLKMRIRKVDVEREKIVMNSWINDATTIGMKRYDL